MSWYCQVCVSRKVSCLGSDPKGCPMPIAHVIYFIMRVVAPITIGIAWFVMSGKSDTTLMVAIVIATMFFRVCNKPKGK